jgi:hypothetical protein
MRVLHLIDAVSPWGGPCTQRLAAQAIARMASMNWLEHDVLVVGTHADVIAAATCGLRADGSIWPLGGARGRTLAAVGGLRRWFAAAHQAGVAPQLAHAWSASAGALAAVALPELPRVVTPRPLAVDGDPRMMTPRDAVRERWKREEGINPDEFVLGLLGEPAHIFDAREAMHVGARTGLSSRRVRMIMSGRALGRSEQQRFLALLALDQVIVQDEAITRPWEVLLGLDAALVMAPVAGRKAWASSMLSSLPALLAQAAGVPIIAEADAPLDGLVEHDRTGLIFPSDDLNMACDRLVRLYDDVNLVKRLTLAAREQATQRFSLNILCERLDTAWHQAIEERRSAYIEPALA